MENKNKTKHPAVKAKAKAAKKLAELKHCCIPKTVVKTEVVEYEDGTTHVVNPNIKPDGNGKFGKEGDYYKELKAKRVEYLKNNYSGKIIKGHRIRRKQPWYMLTRGKCYNYEEREFSWGKCTKAFRVKSESKMFHDNTIVPKFTKEELIIRLLSTKLKDWETKNPKPSKEDLFYWQEIKPWINNYQQYHTKITRQMGLLGKVGNVFQKSTNSTTSTKLANFVKESYLKYETEFKKEYEEHWNKQNAA